jgi:lipopolysaccharide/colanic/teichoic acid biosynthesis glycosyltransferase
MIARADTRENHQVWQNEETPAATSRFWLPLQQWYLPCKSAVSFLCALTLLLLSAPVMLLAALLVKLTSAGPAFYSQTRVGKNGRLYLIYKLRTMYHNCETQSGPRWSTPGDPRITPLGRFLRRTHLDELPQLWNVLRGDMCLIGPRPERPEFIPRLAKALPHYTDRLRVKPGMTGLAQVQLPADTDLDSVRRKLAYDLYYVRHVSPWLDLSILFGTLLYLLGLPTRLMPQLRLVPKRQTVEQTYQDAAGRLATVPMVQPA